MPRPVIPDTQCHMRRLGSGKDAPATNATTLPPPKLAKLIESIMRELMLRISLLLCCNAHCAVKHKLRTGNKTDKKVPGNRSHSMSLVRIGLVVRQAKELGFQPLAAWALAPVFCDGTVASAKTANPKFKRRLLLKSATEHKGSHESQKKSNIFFFRLFLPENRNVASKSADELSFERFQA